MVAPVLQPQTKHVSVYFPIARWYDFYNGLEIGAQSDWVEMDAPFDKINLFQRGGSILPMQNYSMTTEAVRRSPFTISVALDESSESFGELFYDDGDTFEYQKSDQYAHILFTVKNNTLQSQIVHFGMPSLPKLKTVQVFGVQEAPKRVVLNNQEVKFSFVKSVLIIKDMVVAFNKEFILMW